MIELECKYLDTSQPILFSFQILKITDIKPLVSLNSNINASVKVISIEVVVLTPRKLDIS